jgi:hypothetical protein
MSSSKKEIAANSDEGETLNRSVMVSIFEIKGLPIAMKPNSASQPIVYRNEILPLRDKKRTPADNIIATQNISII